MGGNRVVFFCTTFILLATAKGDGDGSSSLAGYISGEIGMPPIDVSNCVNDAILQNPSLSSALDCARTCHAGDPPKICYYSFVVERYPTNGEACAMCSPNVTNSICADCQCVPADGIERMALTVNRMMPGPSVQVCLGDYVVVDVLNKMKEDAVTIHWHGVFQHNYQYYDGVPGVTQCPMTSASSFRYQFQVQNSGTHFWHAHTGLQKMDGIFGSVIVRDPVENDPVRKYYDTDWASHVVVINDWMHEAATGRYPGRTFGVVGQHPDSLLINGRGQTKNFDGVLTNISLAVFPVESGKRHRFRLINSFCAVCPGELTIEDHPLTVIAMDGHPVKPVTVNSIVSFAGERYDFVVNANQVPGTYWIQLRALAQCEEKQVHQLAMLQYVDASDQPRNPPPAYSPGLPEGSVLNPLDVDCQTPNSEAICVDMVQSMPSSGSKQKPEEPDLKIYMPIGFRRFSSQEMFRPNQYTDFLEPGPGLNVQGTMDGIAFKVPASPLISQMSDIPSDQICITQDSQRVCNDNCTCTQLLQVPLHSLVEIILVDESRVANMSHPFHLHGYNFRVLSMGQPLGPYLNSGNSTVITADYVKQLDQEGKVCRSSNSPAHKDTVAVPNNGYVVIQFHADNPGFWLFHCHFVYHQLVGMELVVHVGNQTDLPPVPPHFPKCGNFELPILWNGESTWGPSEYYDYREELMEPVEDTSLPSM